MKLRMTFRRTKAGGKRQWAARAGSDGQRAVDPQSPRTQQPRVLIFNFFGGILLRGIPIYVHNLRRAFLEQGFECDEVVCPRRLQHLPRALLNLLFVLYEQFMMPVLGRSYDAVIYPYNSVSIANSIFREPLLVIHDFISGSRRNTNFAARYIHQTQRIHAWLKGDVAYVSRSTERVGRLSGRFGRSRSYLFPNGFYTFMRALSNPPASSGEHILLCSGWGANKDLGGALELYRDSGLWRRRRLRILGIAGHDDVVRTFCDAFPDLAASVTVLPRLTDAEVGNEYSSAAWVWVHSAREGYGRSIAEARICGRPVVASDIAPFREQRDAAVFLYQGLRRFEAAVADCEGSGETVAAIEPREHAVLGEEIGRYLKDIRRHSR